MYNEYPSQEQAYEQEQAFHTNYTTAQNGEDRENRGSMYSHYSPQEAFSPTLPHNDVRVVAALTYALGWFSGLLFALFSRQRYVRYHALQALIFFGGISVIDLGMLFSFSYRHYHYVPFFSNFLFLLAFMLLNVVAFIGWIIGITQAYRGSYYRLPVVGNMVAHMLGIGADVK